MIPESEKSFDEIRAEVESKQKAILWEDARQGGRSVDAFLWKGDPDAKPIQRAGLVVFAVAFPLFTVALASVPFEKDFEDGWSIFFLLAAGFLAVSLKLFRNAFRRAPRQPEHDSKE